MPGLGQSDERDPTDVLFLERLEAFMEKSLQEIRAFAEREDRMFEETRQHVAEWHCKYLFERRPNDPASPNDSMAQARTLLCDTSRTLESLQAVSGIHSFVLAVDPSDGNDHGFLGGSVLGREFWRGLRGGGDGGVKAFKAHCLRHTEATAGSAVADLPLAAAVSKRGPASSVKTEVYAKVRNALRSTSGVRNAEMKWTNHDRLGAYGVRVVGWPPGIPHQNPSSLTAAQNKLVLDSLDNGTLKFIRRNEEKQSNSSGNVSPVANDAVDFSWACEEGGPSAPITVRGWDLDDVTIRNNPVFERPESDKSYNNWDSLKKRRREDEEDNSYLTFKLDL